MSLISSLMPVRNPRFLIIVFILGVTTLLMFVDENFESGNGEKCHSGEYSQSQQVKSPSTGRTAGIVKGKVIPIFQTILILLAIAFLLSLTLSD